MAHIVECSTVLQEGSGSAHFRFADKAPNRRLFRRTDGSVGPCAVDGTDCATAGWRTAMIVRRLEARSRVALAFSDLVAEFSAIYQIHRSPVSGS
jgi:hypothetical protein